MSDLEERLRLQLAEFPSRRLLVGLSGGLDSMVLLHVGLSLRDDLTAIHVNHGLHPRAKAWQQWCAEVCRRLGADFLAREVRVENAGEAGARAARYAAFDALLGPGDLLLLGHHGNDQAETLLLRLVQGRSPLGMPRTRRLPGGGRILRPWLSTGQEHLAHYARSASLDWIDDPSNAETNIDRNFIRHEILPRLQARWPGVVRALGACTEVQLARDALLAQLAGADADYGGVVNRGRDAPATPEHLDASHSLSLTALPTELRVAALRLWLSSLGEHAVSDRALAEFVRQLRSSTDAQPSMPLQRGTLRRFGSDVVYDTAVPPLRSQYRLDLPGKLELPHGDLIVERHDAGFHADGVLTVRFRSGGERLRSGGKSRSVKKLMQAAGIPPWQRAEWPLVYSGNRLVAIAGVAVADTLGTEPRWRLSWRPKGR